MASPAPALNLLVRYPLPTRIGRGEFVEELTPAPGEATIYKHRYSGFKGTDLGLILRARRIQTCVLTGVSTNVCVESTLRDAFELDHYVVVPEDAVASWNMDLHRATLETVKHRVGTVTNDRFRRRGLVRSGRRTAPSGMTELGLS